MSRPAFNGRCAVALVCLSAGVWGAAQPALASSDADALAIQQSHATLYMLNNVSQPGAAPGSIVASPSRVAPDYYFHWIRDSALVFQALLRLHVDEPLILRRSQYLEQLKAVVTFSRRVQGAKALTGLGEPKFHVDGTAFDGPWSRPQNDGPALRAVGAVAFANLLLDRGEAGYVREQLYGNEYPARTLIKTDVEYVALHWRDQSFDLWEESRGDHFYTRMAQRRALVDGADLADRLGDGGAAYFYRVQAHALEAEIARHWDPLRGIVLATLNPTEGVPYKTSGLDLAVILGALHGARGDGFFDPSDERILATAARLQREFGRVYFINHGLKGAVAIGRYPEDRYDGVGVVEIGNPWFIGVHAFAELCYRAAAEFRARGSIDVTDANRDFFRDLFPDGAFTASGVDWLDGRHRYMAGGDEYEHVLTALGARGDAFMRLALNHMKQENGAMSEQFNRDTGFMQGANDLTWSYASYMTAYWARGGARRP